jgi:V-type H+-transporting ATPase subunit F
VSDEDLTPSPLSAETPQATLEEAFKDFVAREDIAVVVINQWIANTMRHLLDGYTRPVPAIIEVPSKTLPYDPSQDSVLARVKYMFGDI